MKKERPGYEWGPRWGADGSSSPAFAWGQALVSGEEIVSATICKAKLVPSKNLDGSCKGGRIFFSLCDGVSLKVSNRATFQGNRGFCKLRWLRQMRPWNFQNEDACILRIAEDGLHGGVYGPSEFSRGHGGPRH